MFSPAESGALYRRVRAFTDLHFYQKWHAVWPQLARLDRQGVRLLDAGCGDGQWAVEIARRRPGWTVTGVDRDALAIERARALQEGLNLSNISFEPREFFGFVPIRPFDVVLSVCSTHYGPTTLDIERLFTRMRDWLNPGGQLVMLVPRRVGEAPFVSRLNRPRWHEVFSRQGLTDLCAASDLRPALIAPFIGRLGTIAKQLDWSRGDAPAPASGAMGILARGMALVDAHVPPPSGRSLMWLLVADRRK
jgi:SAM-dependent methyltransferase